MTIKGMENFSDSQEPVEFCLWKTWVDISHEGRLVLDALNHDRIKRLEDMRPDTLVVVGIARCNGLGFLPHYNCSVGTDYALLLSEGGWLFIVSDRNILAYLQEGYDHLQWDEDPLCHVFHFRYYTRRGKRVSVYCHSEPVRTREGQ